jgi:hypothetical protein
MIKNLIFVFIIITLIAILSGCSKYENAQFDILLMRTNL